MWKKQVGMTGWKTNVSSPRAREKAASLAGEGHHGRGERSGAPSGAGQLPPSRGSSGTWTSPCLSDLSWEDHLKWSNKNASSHLPSDQTPKFEKHHFGSCLQRLKPFPKRVFISVSPQVTELPGASSHLTSGNGDFPLPPPAAGPCLTQCRAGPQSSASLTTHPTDGDSEATSVSRAGLRFRAKQWSVCVWEQLRTGSVSQPAPTHLGLIHADETLVHFGPGGDSTDVPQLVGVLGKGTRLHLEKSPRGREVAPWEPSPCSLARSSVHTHTHRCMHA